MHSLYACHCIRKMESCVDDSTSSRLDYMLIISAELLSSFSLPLRIHRGKVYHPGSYPVVGIVWPFAFPELLGLLTFSL